MYCTVHSGLPWQPWIGFFAGTTPPEALHIIGKVDRDRGPANNSKKGVKPMEKVNNNNNIDFSSATFTFHEMAPVQIAFVSLVT